MTGAELEISSSSDCLQHPRVRSAPDFNLFQFEPLRSAAAELQDVHTANDEENGVACCSFRIRKNYVFFVLCVKQDVNNTQTHTQCMSKKKVTYLSQHKEEFLVAQ